MSGSGSSGIYTDPDSTNNMHRGIIGGPSHVWFWAKWNLDRTRLYKNIEEILGTTPFAVGEYYNGTYDIKTWSSGSSMGNLCTIKGPCVEMPSGRIGLLTLLSLKAFLWGGGGGGWEKVISGYNLLKGCSSASFPFHILTKGFLSPPPLPPPPPNS
jgi:hypothetical protein